AGRDEQQSGEEHLRGGLDAGVVDDGQHTDAGASVVFAVDPRDGEEVRKLPEELNREERPEFGGDASGGGDPTEAGGHRAGKCSDEGRQRGHALERCVDESVTECGGGAEERGE